MAYQKISKVIHEKDLSIADVVKAYNGDVASLLKIVQRTFNSVIQKDSAAVKTLVKMAQQGDLDASDLLMFKNTARGRERAIISKVLRIINVNDSNDVGEFRKNRRNY